MENKKTKNHKENWIGNIIRGFLLFMPLLAIGVTCAYAIFNKNAKDSYSNDYIYRQYAITTQQQWNQDIVYNFTYKNDYTSTSNTGNFNLYYIGLTPEDLNITQVQYDNISKWQITTQNKIVFKDSNSTRITDITIEEGLSFDFRSEYFSSLLLVGNISEIVYKQIGLDNVFYYSINKVQQSPLFNWAENTGMYTVIHNACNTLGIQSTFVPFLLSYWLLTYLIYIIYDIALLIVNMAHNRIHDVESSI